MTTAPATSTMVDDEWLSAPPRRSRFRLALLVLLATAVVILAGVEVQKRYGAVAPATSSALPSFAGAGGFTPPSGTGPAADRSATSSTSTSAVIGTLVSVKGDVWKVKDLGGHVHTVTVGSTVRIVKEKSIAAGNVKAGSTLDISGTKDSEGNVTATTVTVR